MSFRRRRFFLCFSHCKSMGANDPRGGAIFDPRGMIDRIYIEDHYTLLHTKYESFGPCGFREDFFFYIFPMTPPGRGPYGPQGARLAGFMKRTTRHCYIQIMKAWALWFQRRFFLCFSHCKSMGAICCHGNQSSDPTWPKT